MTGAMEQARALIGDFATSLAQPFAPPKDEPWAGQSLATGAAGIALFHIEQAATGQATWRPAHRWISQAAAGDITATDSTGLYLGAPAVAFVLQAAPDSVQHLYRDARTALHGHVVNLTHRRVDSALARMYRGAHTTFAEYDTFYGLTGIGAYLLRAAPNSDAMEKVLRYLVSLTHPLDSDGPATPGWWVDHDTSRSHSLPGGHGNLGVAHGITGPLLLLAQAHRRGIQVDGQAEAIRAICDHLDMWRQESDTGLWWPEHLTLTDLQTGRPHQHKSARPSWCYGTPGIARAGQLAGIALGDAALQHAYEDALYQCLSDPVQLARVIDTSLCHGWAGVLQTAFRAARDARTPQLTSLLPALSKNLITHAQPAAAQGPGFLEGDAGCALALATVSTDQAPTTGWDACLLIN
ncbi:lanthionine synthetase C family protein [Streptomyces sp. NBC_01304]|uniref:lanthionine synthetase C family protein n=1 Tax=Streptomyces sp. NBC_01304 TaxID=2903818 RepID=UPI002E0F0DC8|nr:lanthionine synthetase C family protein [Streptomyces sp. NBC_01304]